MMSRTQWDFSSEILHHPKLHSFHHNLPIIASSLSPRARWHGDTLIARRSIFLRLVWMARSCTTTAPSRNEVAIVQPVLLKQLENDILAFLPRWLLTSTKVGHVKMWIRPLPATSRKNEIGRAHV